MPLDKRELSYLWDMQNAAKEIREFMLGVKFHERLSSHGDEPPCYTYEVR